LCRSCSDSQRLRADGKRKNLGLFCRGDEKSTHFEATQRTALWLAEVTAKQEVVLLVNTMALFMRAGI